MSHHSNPAPLAGSIVFPFENLYILRQSGEARICGRATFSFNGQGAANLIGLEVDSATFGAPSRVLKFGVPEWREIARRLERYHGDDYRARIDEELNRGGHMALFSEMRPPEFLRRPLPPIARARPDRMRQRPAWTMRPAVTTAAEAMALGLLMAGIMGVCLVVDQPHALHPHNRIATLETGVGR